jgi:hypothetical protein
MTDITGFYRSNELGDAVLDVIEVNDAIVEVILIESVRFK